MSSALNGKEYMSKKKKQHYVPRLYLEKWCIEGTNHTNVYDKIQNKFRNNHIEDVASENYFYDINLEGVLSPQEIEHFGLQGVDLSKVDDKQYIENLFADTIEITFENILEQIISRVRGMNAWEIKNCLFIKSEDAHLFSIIIAIQYLRVKEIRDSIKDSSKLLERALNDMGASQTVIDEYCKISKNQMKYIHGKMLMNTEEILDFAQIFDSHIWILLKNKTDQKFLTSDNPIGTIAHINDPILSMSGIASKGVEVYFPLSPDLLLIMLEKTYHTNYEYQNYRIVEVDKIDMVEYYNSYCVMNSSRCVYSINDDFSIVDKLKAKKADILQSSKSELLWNGKTYTN